MADITRGEPPALDLIVRIHEDRMLTPQVRNYGPALTAKDCVIALGVLAAHWAAGVVQTEANADSLEDSAPEDFLEWALDGLCRVAEDAFWDELTHINLREPHSADEALG